MQQSNRRSFADIPQSLHLFDLPCGQFGFCGFNLCSKLVERLAIRVAQRGADFGIDVAGAGDEYVTGAQRGPKGGAAYISEDPPKEAP